MYIQCKLVDILVFIVLFQHRILCIQVHLRCTKVWLAFHFTGWLSHQSNSWDGQQDQEKTHRWHSCNLGRHDAVQTSADQWTVQVLQVSQHVLNKRLLTQLTLYTNTAQWQGNEAEEKINEVILMNVRKMFHFLFHCWRMKPMHQSKLGSMHEWPYNTC